MNIHEYQAKAVLREFGVPVAARRRRLHGRRGGEGARRSWPAGLGGEGADPCRRPRQGRRRQGRCKSHRRRGARKSRRACSARRWSPTRPARTASRSTASISRTAPTIDRELYLSVLVDRVTSRVAFVVSTEGGMDIEEVAHDTPEKIVTVSVDPATGIMPHHGAPCVAGAEARRRPAKADRARC